jgi:polar amino acid transport system substrate-binding protein
MGGQRFRSTPSVVDMNNYFRWAIWYSLCCILLGGVLSGCQPVVSAVEKVNTSPSAEKTSGAVIRLTTGDWVPYIGKDLPHYGCDTWVVSEAFGLVGISIEYGFFPWARGFRMAEAGSWDGTMEWANTAERQDAFYFSADFLSSQEWVFFYRSDRPFDWQSLDDLKGKVVGVTSGYTYSDAFAGLERKGWVTFEEANTDEANFKKLLAGRIDIFPMERRVGDWVMRRIFTREEQEQITAHPKAFNRFQPYLLLSKAVKGNDERMRQFDQGFAQLKASGRYDEIMGECLH